MADLSIVFKLIDNITSPLEKLAGLGDNVADVFGKVEDVSNDAFSKMESGAESAAKQLENAATSTDYWTDAIGNYDKSAMEFMYTTEELVELGYKTEEALQAEARASEDAAEALAEMGETSEEAGKQQEEMGRTGAEAADAISSALAAAGITKMLNDAKDAVVDLANAWSEAESIIVKATGATADQMAGLSQAMNDVYRTTNDGELANTAAAIGEINTRLDLEGEALEHVTGLYMDFARITDTNVVPAIQSTTKVMKNWGVEVDDTELLLDKLSYAAQASGISVDSLSDMLVTNKAMLQGLGYELDSSIGLLAAFEKEGINSSTVMMGFRTALNNFSKEGRDAATAMQETVDQIDILGDTFEANNLAAEVFGERAGPELARAIQTGQFSIEEWTAAIEESAGTLAHTADAATTLDEKWTKASNNMKTAFSKVLSPAVDGASSSMAEFVDTIADFLNETPAVTAVISALGVGLAGAAAVLAVYAAKTVIATLKTAIFGATTAAAFAPITIFVGTLAAFSAGFVLLSNALDGTTEEYRALTMVSRQNHDQLQELNAEYERTCEAQGATSYEAQALKWELEDLQAEFESTKVTMEEYKAVHEDLMSSHNQMMTTLNDSVADIDHQEKSVMALVSKLQELGSATEQTAGDKEVMLKIIDKLNEQMPELGLTYESVTESLGAAVSMTKEYAEALAEQQREEAKFQAWIDAMATQEDLTDNLVYAKENLAAAEEAYNEQLFKGVSGFHQLTDEYKDSKTQFEYWAQAVEEAENALDECNDVIAEGDALFDSMADSISDTSDATQTWQSVLNSALQDVSGDLEALKIEYDEVYESAYNSIDGQIGLFENMTGAVAEYASQNKVSTDELIASFQSQAEYMNSYQENLKAARDLELSAELINELSDGSIQSAAILEEIVKSGEDKVAELNTAFEGVEQGKEDFAETVAAIATDFDDRMTEIEERLNEAMDNMNLEEDAASAAQSTIDAYISTIESSVGAAESAAGKVANAVSAILNSGGVSDKGVYVPSAPYRGYATGTLSAEPGLAVVGEKGPEIINFRGGETVIPADESERIMAATRTASLSGLPSGVSYAENLAGSSAEKTVKIEINGNGKIGVNGGSKEGVLEVMIENMRPVLMGILQEEVYEGGDRSYEF